MPILTSVRRLAPAARFARVYIPLGVLVTAWDFLRATGSRGREELCFLTGRRVAAGDSAAAQVTACVLPVTIAAAAHVTLTDLQQTDLILDLLDEREEEPVMSLHTHPDGGDGAAGPHHSQVDDDGVALGPGDGLLSAVIPHYAQGSPFTFPHQCGVHERIDGVWRRLTPVEREQRIVVYQETVKLVRRRDAAED